MMRVATPDDLSEVYSLLEVMHQEYTNIGRVDAAKARGAILDIIKAGGCIVSEKDGKIIGTVGIFKSTPWFSSDEIWSDQWFYVHPDHRADGHATRFIACLKAAANKEGRPFVLSVNTTERTLSKLKYFKKHMQPFGGNFIYFPEAA